MTNNEVRAGVEDIGARLAVDRREKKISEETASVRSFAECRDSTTLLLWARTVT